MIKYVMKQFLIWNTCIGARSCTWIADNGETVKLRGTCIHHDNGVIGAETFKEAEWYRCKRLKEAGFNAIRSAHHPMSRAMLDACDHIGILVMDELTDMWDKEKIHMISPIF